MQSVEDDVVAEAQEIVQSPLHLFSSLGFRVPDFGFRIQV